MLVPSFNVRHRIDSFGMDSGIRPARFGEVFGAFGQRWGVAARRYGVTHVLLQQGARPPANGVLVGRNDLARTEIWSVPHRPWAIFAPAVETVPDLARAKIRLLQLHEQASDAVVVEANVDATTAPGVIHSVTRAGDRLEVDAETSRDSVLVVNDAFAPGWRATIDGVAVPIWPADILVRAVRWPAGRHRLSMEYDPPEVTAGLLVSALGLLLLATACLARGAPERGSAETASQEENRAIDERL